MPPKYVTYENTDFFKALASAKPVESTVVTVHNDLFDPRHGGVVIPINNSVKKDEPKINTSYTIPALLFGGLIIVLLITKNR